MPGLGNAGAEGDERDRQGYGKGETCGGLVVCLDCGDDDMNLHMQWQGKTTPTLLINVSFLVLIPYFTQEVTVVKEGSGWWYRDVLCDILAISYRSINISKKFFFFLILIQPWYSKVVAVYWIPCVTESRRPSNLNTCDLFPEKLVPSGGDLGHCLLGFDIFDLCACLCSGLSYSLWPHGS